MRRWEVLEDCSEEDGTPTVWSSEINSTKYGRYCWISISQSGSYLVEIDRGSGIEVIKECKSLVSAKRWVSMNI